MKTIGITGGVGAGKTRILEYLKKRCRCRILPADSVAHIVEAPGQVCYEKLLTLLGSRILMPDGQIDRKKMAAIIFQDSKILMQVDAIVHPEVKKYILNEIEKERSAGDKDFFFLEAALLIEEGYGEILDELWYIYADSAARRRRLKEYRSYPDEKIDRIFASQLTEEQFRAHCKEVIDNGGSLSDTYMQIEKILEKQSDRSKDEVM